MRFELFARRSYVSKALRALATLSRSMLDSPLFDGNALGHFARRCSVLRVQPALATFSHFLLDSHLLDGNALGSLCLTVQRFKGAARLCYSFALFA